MKMQMRIKALAARLCTVFFPRRCPFCGRVMLPEERCCAGCIPRLPRYDVEKACPRCGKRRCVCGENPILSSTAACFYYEGAAEYAVQALKFHHRPGYARSLAAFLAEAVRKTGRTWDLLVPVPMTAKKRWKRGYNQAELLARFLAEELGIPEAPAALQKIRETKAQHTLTAEARKSNLSGAYAAESGTVTGKRVLVVDDVLTTGSTLREAALALQSAGAEEVGAVVLCCVEREKE